jgi:cell wall-associated NlpC family hydrolase
VADTVGKTAGKGAWKGVKATGNLALALVLFLVAALATGGFVVSNAVLSDAARLKGPPKPTTEQCSALPAGWCEVVYHAQQYTEKSGRMVPVPWTVIAGIARVQTNFGQRSPYDTEQRYPDRAAPPYLVQNAPTMVGGDPEGIPVALSWDRGCHVPAPDKPIGGDGVTTPVNTTIPTGTYAEGGLIALGKRLQDMGFIVFESPYFPTPGAPNGVTPGGHMEGSLHYAGEAIDVNWPNPAEEKRMIDSIIPLAKEYKVGIIWQSKNHYDHVHFDTLNRWKFNNVDHWFEPKLGSSLVNGGPVPVGGAAIGATGEEGLGPFLLRPSAIGGWGGDPQHPCEAARFVAEKLSLTARDMLRSDPSLMPKTNDATSPEAAAFWQQVMNASGIFADPHAAPVCTVDSPDDVGVDAMIEHIWRCELNATPELFVIDEATTGQDGKVGFSTLNHTAATGTLIREAKGVAYAYSKWELDPDCDNEATYAGVFPLTKQVAATYGATDRCDPQANIRAAAKAVIAGEVTKPEDRDSTDGPYAPMLGGWANIAPALGQEAKTFAKAGPAQSWVPSAECTATISTWLQTLAARPAPFASLAGKTGLPANTSPFTKAIAAAGENPMLSRVCAGPTPEAFAGTALVSAQTLVDAATEHERPEAPDPLGPEGATPTVTPKDPTGDLPYDVDAMRGLTTWFAAQAATQAPPKARFGKDSLIPRLQVTPKTVELGEASAPAQITVPALPWQEMSTDWAIFYGGVAPKWDSFGTISDRMAGSNGEVPAATVGVFGTASQQASVVIQAAMSQLGVPYAWGGGGPSGPTRGINYAGIDGSGVVGFDCSSLMQYAFNAAGITLPRTTYDQVKQGTAVASISQAAPGDLVFSRAGVRGPEHVMLYLGDNQVIEAPRMGKTVQVRQLKSGEVVAIRRVITDAGTGVYVPAGSATPVPGDQYVPVPGNVEVWIAQALQVLYANGFPRGTDDAAALRIIIQHESSGRYGPHDSVNNWDSNATGPCKCPSFGLMQTIPATFDSYKLPPWTNKWDPRAQIIAGSRYAQSRYGGLDNVPGVKAVRAGKPYVGY